MNDYLEVLRRELIGKSFGRFSLGNTLDLSFDNCYLTAQEFRFDSDEAVTVAVQEALPAAKDAVDSSDISGAVALAAAKCCDVVEVVIWDDGTLILTFSNGSIMTLPTDTEIVDWHWALTREQNDPYLDSIVGAFEDGQIK